MNHVVAIANQKGGVGKTTSAVNLAASLAAAEHRVLLIDGDPQGNATSGMGLQRSDLNGTLYEVLLGLTPAGAVIRRSVHFQTLDLLPSTTDLAGAEVELVGLERRELLFRDAIAAVRENYEFVLVDCPPSLGLLTVNILAGSDFVLIPLQCEYFAMEGLSQLLQTVSLTQGGLNAALRVIGVLLTMYDGRLNLSRQVAEEARQFFGPLVFETVIPRNIRLAEAPSFGRPILLYDIGSVGATTYISAAKELAVRLKTSVSVDLEAHQPAAP